MLAGDRNPWTSAISDYYDQAAVEPNGSNWIKLKVSKSAYRESSLPLQLPHQ